MGYAVNVRSPKNYMPAVVRKVAVHHRICMVHALNEGDLDRHLTVWVNCWAWLESLNWGIPGQWRTSDSANTIGDSPNDTVTAGRIWYNATVGIRKSILISVSNRTA
jgi:hypothetical protein